MTRPLVVSLCVALLTSCSDQSGTISNDPSTASADSTSIRVVLASEVEWEALNPARGDMSPKAGTLWGDRNGEQATGFLAKFTDGFSSPPHIHNVTYRAVVIEGRIHNDDPKATIMWMGSGSFWTQPKGETHITAAKGESNIALVEIDQGPYLVRPPSQAFDSGERPLNLDTSNVVWLPLSQGNEQLDGAYISYLWGRYEQGHRSGSFVKVPAGFVGKISAPGTVLHAVIIQGNMMYGPDQAKDLTPGSYFGAQGPSEHQITASGDRETVIYIRTNGPYQLHGNG